MGTSFYLSVLCTMLLTSLQCDEAKPICGGCGRHQVTCVYDHPARAIAMPDSEAPSVTSSSSKTKAAEPYDTGESTKRRLLECTYISTVFTFWATWVRIMSSTPTPYSTEGISRISLQAWVSNFLWVKLFERFRSPEFASLRVKFSTP